ncbi:MAG TPA: alpha/beta hydrolase [Leptospiraceae bacterium]|nr:alpha/beta hydrolase [Leptospiraceae bacterium]
MLLFAADEDDDAFEYDYKLKRLPDLARRVTVYHNSGDKALIISDITKGNPDRLGAGGPRNSRILPDKVTVVNVEPVLAIADDITSHNYYLSDETVRQDAISVLNGTEPQDIKIREYQSELRTYRLKKKSV